MNGKAYPTILMTAVLLLGGAGSTIAQHENHGQQKPTAQAGEQRNRPMDMHHGSMNMSKMIDGGHDVLAKAYMQNVGAFARTLKDRVDSAKSVDADFARAAVAEMRRSFDTMQQHMTEQKKTIPAEMQPPAGMQSHAGMQSPAGTQPGASMKSHAAMQAPSGTQSAAGSQSHGAMMQGEDQHLLEIRQTLELLEREVDSNSPRANKISERAAAIIKHIEMLTMSSSGHKDHKM